MLIVKTITPGDDDKQLINVMQFIFQGLLDQIDLCSLLFTLSYREQRTIPERAQSFQMDQSLCRTGSFFSGVSDLRADIKMTQV